MLRVIGRLFIIFSINDGYMAKHNNIKQTATTEKSQITFKLELKLITCFAIRTLGK